MTKIDDAAYAVIGRAIIEWGLLEQRVVRQIWRAKDPHRVSPFPPDIDDRTFSTKWTRWRSLHQVVADDDTAFETLSSDAIAASKMRNNLCHHVFEVASGFGQAFSIGVHRRELNWRKAFAKWAGRWARADARTRPPPPGDEIIRYRKGDLDDLMVMIDSIRERMDGYAEKLAASHG